ncbi:hypothetical protein BJ741DRAFT_627641 [Chytriomyces cf. hyalinus JEL632]|nr:hypothetical protein BJ741DRAFT_627641 [Chytriomyces cf. hyalinus JEL632]
MLIDTQETYPLLVYASGLLVAAVAAQFISLVYFVVCVERGKDSKAERIATPFTTLLLAMVASILFLGLTEIICIRAVETQELSYYEPVRVVQYLFMSTSEVSYINYTWLRSRDIVHQTFPKLKGFAKYFIWIHSTFTLLQFTPALLGLLIPSIPHIIVFVSNVFTIVVAAATVLFDLFLLILFITYLRSSRGIIPAHSKQRSEGTSIICDPGVDEQSISMLQAKPVNQAKLSSLRLTLNPKSALDRATTIARNRALVADTSDLDPHMVIIACYGLISLLCGYVIVGLMVAWMITYERYLVLIFYFMDGIFCSLFAMKVALWRLKRKP